VPSVTLFPFPSQTLISSPCLCEFSDQPLRGFSLTSPMVRSTFGAAARTFIEPVPTKSVTTRAFSPQITFMPSGNRLLVPFLLECAKPHHDVPPKAHCQDSSFQDRKEAAPSLLFPTRFPVALAVERPESRFHLARKGGLFPFSHQMWGHNNTASAAAFPDRSAFTWSGLPSHSFP